MTTQKTPDTESRAAARFDVPRFMRINIHKNSSQSWGTVARDGGREIEHQSVADLEQVPQEPSTLNEVDFNILSADQEQGKTTVQISVPEENVWRKETACLPQKARRRTPRQRTRPGRRGKLLRLKQLSSSDDDDEREELFDDIEEKNGDSTESRVVVGLGNECLFGLKMKGLGLPRQDTGKWVMSDVLVSVSVRRHRRGRTIFEHLAWHGLRSSICSIVSLLEHSSCCKECLDFRVGDRPALAHMAAFFGDIQLLEKLLELRADFTLEAKFRGIGRQGLSVLTVAEIRNKAVGNKLRELIETKA